MVDEVGGEEAQISDGTVEKLKERERKGRRRR